MTSLVEKIVAKNFDPSIATSIEQLVLFNTECSIIAKFGYEALGLDIPEWMTEKMTATKCQVEHLQRVAKKKELKMLQARVETLKSQAERRKETEDRIAELEKELNK